MAHSSLRGRWSQLTASHHHPPLLTLSQVQVLNLEGPIDPLTSTPNPLSQASQRAPTPRGVVSTQQSGVRASERGRPGWWVLKEGYTPAPPAA